MTNYTCEKCNKEFFKKSSYDSHLERIKSCVNNTKIHYECINCNKTYSTKYNLKVHICKKLLEDDKQEQIDELKKLLFEHQKKLEELSKDKEKETRLAAIQELINFDFFGKVFWKMNELQKKQIDLNSGRNLGTLV